MKTLTTKLVVVALTWLATASVVCSQSLPIYTMAGHDEPGSADGLSSHARFNNANGVAVDTAGNIYVADTGNGTIRKITLDGQVTTFAGYPGVFGSANGAGTSARFFGPQGITVDYVGVIYVADTANATIRKISSTGLVAPFAGSASNYNSFDGTAANANFHQPEGLAVDASRNVYVADAWNHTIRKITQSAVVTTLAGLAGNPGSVDGTNSKARFNRPSGIAADNVGNLFVTDSLNHTVRKITPAGLVTTIAGLAGVWGSADGTNSGARFFLPQGITMLNASNLVVVDSGNQTLRKISVSGTNWVVTTLAGLQGVAGNASGMGSNARFEFPAGLAMDAGGFLYIADAGNNEVRTTRVVPPTLKYTKSANGLLLSWPIAASGFVLESASNLSGAVWTSRTNGVMTIGDEFVVSLSADEGAGFYRLRSP
ncbi:MAG TPA: NHL repeat-containing protein [Verrucomicrobiae bacterium]|nr:NHL repeat-containing protein [Verrucomicrobiae bacterium]